MLEDLGPLQRLRGETGERGEEAQVGLVELGEGDEGEREDPERAGATHERLAHDRHRLGQLVQDPGHDLRGNIVRDVLFGFDRGEDGPAAREAGAGVGPIERHHDAGEQRGMAAAGQAGQAAFAEGGDAYHGGVRPQSTTAAGDGRVGDVPGCRRGGQGRAELVQVLAAFQVDELGERQPGPFDRLRRSAGDGEEEGPVRFGDLTVVVPVDDHRSDGVIRDDQGDDGEGPEPVRAEGREDVGALALQVVDGLREEGDVAAQNGAVDLQRRQHPVGRVVGGVAEAA